MQVTIQGDASGFIHWLSVTDAERDRGGSVGAVSCGLIHDSHARLQLRLLHQTFCGCS
jgi:hypothetical protein